MDNKQNPENINPDTIGGNPLNNSLKILARIVARVYRRNLILSRLFFTSDAAVTYFEWPMIIFDDGTPRMEMVWVPAGSCDFLLHGDHL